MRGLWQQLLQTHGPVAAEELSGRWQRLEAKLITIVNSMSLTPAGQTVLSALLPVTVLAALFPTRITCHAYQLPPGATYYTPRAPRPAPPSLWRLGCGALTRALSRAAEEAAVAARGAYLLALFAPALLTAPLVFLLGFGRAAWLGLLRWTLEQAGPAFIKWGQWGSTRPDLFPPDVCATLETLQSGAPAHAPRLSRAAVEAAFGRPLPELFSAWEDAPVASGSIAQIHRARLSPAAAARCGAAPGALVAVKVRHPGVSTLMARDFVLMARAAALSARLPGLRALRLDESVRQFGGPLQEQLDLSVEASHLSRFAHNFRHWRNVVFPTPLYPLVAPDVLVESYEHGALITGYTRAKQEAAADAADAAAAAAAGALRQRAPAPGACEGGERGGGGASCSGRPLPVSSAAAQREWLRSNIAETGLNAYLQMLLKDNFIHADMHPGNILVREVERGGSAWWPSKRAGAGEGLTSWVAGLGRRAAQALVAALPPALQHGVAASVSSSNALLGRGPTPQLVLLDTGMIAQLSSADQAAVVAFFRALTQRDGAAVASAMLDMSERHTCRNPDAFVADLTHMFDALDPGYVRQHTSEVLRDMIESLRQHQVTLKSTVSTVVVTTLVLEGWSSQLDPELRIMDTLKELLADDWKERLGRVVDKVMASGSLAVA